MRNPYESLAVPRSATADDIKKSFRQLAKQLHPDANRTDPEAAARFAEVNAAHAILSDKKKRRAFDRGDIDADGRPTRVATRSRRNTTMQHACRLAILTFMLAATSTLMVSRAVAPEHVGVAQPEESHRGLRGDSDRSADRAMPSPTSTVQKATDRVGGSQPDRLQSAHLIARAEKLMSEGDIEAARAPLERAAASHDPRAAFILGSTYDPVMLAILRARGVAADVSKARIWYRKASELGSREAQERLDLLASPRISR
jgi:curved DNA-binding protein CbpA